MKNYKVVSANDILILEFEVQKLMNQYLSWTPVGGVTVTTDGETVTYYQAMVY